MFAFFAWKNRCIFGRESLEPLIMPESKFNEKFFVLLFFKRWTILRGISKQLWNQVSFPSFRWRLLKHSGFFCKFFLAGKCYVLVPWKFTFVTLQRTRESQYQRLILTTGALRYFQSKRCRKYWSNIEVVWLRPWRKNLGHYFFA